MGDILDVEQSIEWASQRLGEAGILFKHIYEKRIGCYKNGELLLDSEYGTIREGIRQKKRNPQHDLLLIIL